VDAQAGVQPQDHQQAVARADFFQMIEQTVFV
jgi:hypothetical protein